MPESLYPIGPEDQRRIAPEREKGDAEIIEARLEQAETDLASIKSGKGYQISSEVEGSASYWRCLAGGLKEEYPELSQAAERIVEVLKEGGAIRRKTVDTFVREINSAILEQTKKAA